MLEFVSIEIATSGYEFADSRRHRVDTLSKVEVYKSPVFGVSKIGEGIIAFEFNGASEDPNSAIISKYYNYLLIQ